MPPTTYYPRKERGPMERGTFQAAEQAAKQGDPVAAYGLMRQTLIENPTHVPMLAASVAAQQCF